MIHINPYKAILAQWHSNEPDGISLDLVYYRPDNEYQIRTFDSNGYPLDSDHWPIYSKLDDALTVWNMLIDC